MTQPHGKFDLSLRLRREAERGSPPFSPTLHARVMRGIEGASPLAEGRARGRPAGFGLIAKRYLMAASVAAIVAIVVIATHPWHAASERRVADRRPQPTVAPPPPAVPDVHLNVAAVTRPAEQRLLEARFAYLDVDARRLTNYMLDQMDVLPAKK